MLGACLGATSVHSMPAVLSKHLGRIPLEDFYCNRRQFSSVESVPVDAVRTIVLEKRLTPPRLAWSSYAAKEGIREPELAQRLLDLVDPLSCEVHKTLASKGYDRTSTTYWILEEEVHAFREVLNNATSDLRDISQNAAMGEKWLRRARKRIEVFVRS